MSAKKCMSESEKTKSGEHSLNSIDIFYRSVTFNLEK